MTNKSQLTSQVSNEEIKTLVIERIKSMPEGMNVSLGNTPSSLTKDQLIEQVQGDTDLGKTIIEIQIDFLQSLKTGELLCAE